MSAGAKGKIMELHCIALPFVSFHSERDILTTPFKTSNSV